MVSNWNYLLFLCRKEKERSEGGGRRKETEEERQIRKQKERERRENETEEERNIRSAPKAVSQSAGDPTYFQTLAVIAIAHMLCNQTCVCTFGCGLNLPIGEITCLSMSHSFKDTHLVLLKGSSNTNI